MDTDLIMLGTGNAMAINCYNTCFAIQQGEEYFLVDAGGGNGILKQLSDAKIPSKSIHHMFVTHAHTDHVLGVIWVVRKIAMLMQGGVYSGNFIIYCHDEVANTIMTLCEMTLPRKLLKYLGDRIIIQEVKDNEMVTAIGISFMFFDIHSTKTKQFGFRAELPNKKILSCLGDEPFKESCRRYVEGNDWLMSEAFCLYSEKDIFKPYEKNHSTALDAGKLAESLHIKNLVIYHTEDTNMSGRKEAYTKEVRTVFKGNIFVPNDLERISLS